MLAASDIRGLCILDSCGVGKPGSNRLIAGVNPVRTVSWASSDPESTLDEFEKVINSNECASVFTISYDFGPALQGTKFSTRLPIREPDIFVAQFGSLLVHDYVNGTTKLTGPSSPDSILEQMLRPDDSCSAIDLPKEPASTARSNLTRAEYIELIEQLKELIRSGETYQTNLTQQLTVDLPEGISAAVVFDKLRRQNAAPFAAYLDRGDSFVVSASPELFFTVSDGPSGRIIESSPIKGTLPRGLTPNDDRNLRQKLAQSLKDRAENTMIVDLMRNDLGRICDFGSVNVTDLCSVEDHPTLFQMVSTVRGTLRNGTGYSDILRALFPCGSITGAPKLRTMEIIDRLESAPRGLSMGAIGCRIPPSLSSGGEIFEASVAIRTMVIRDGAAVFNVGGGIVIDSDPASEYAESMLKARALLEALGVEVEG